jgi:hypothetical protein
MHVGDLDGAPRVDFDIWGARATITVHGTGHGPLANAQVTGTWSSPGIGQGSCTTNALGQCVVRIGPLPLQQPTVAFTVANVTRPGFTYQPQQNHDPDGDSDGTSITVAHP